MTEQELQFLGISPSDNTNFHEHHSNCVLQDGSGDRDVAGNVAQVLDFISETLCLIPGGDLDISASAVGGLATILMDCSSALKVVEAGPVQKDPDAKEQ